MVSRVGRDRDKDRPVRRRRALVAATVVIVSVIAIVVVGSIASPRTGAAQIVHVTIRSRFVHAREPITLVSPPGGGSGRPLLIFLHGRGGDQNSELSDQFFAALDALGARGPDVAFPYGGDHSYWHDRASGAWAEYVLREVLPVSLRRLHADPARVAIGGISMGGFGAYDIARLDPGRFCAIGGDSAALWPAGSDTAAGAFDNAADFARNNLLAITAADPQVYERAHLWLDGGDQDPFHVADETLAAHLGIRMHVWPGGHDYAYWNAHWGSYLRFYAASLTNCKQG
jgi:S-formylglutathione hydrolase FrmB